MTTYLFDGFDVFCDSEPSVNDCHNCGPPDKPYVYCWPCITPITFILDIISIPYRYYIQRTRNKSTELTESTELTDST